MIRVDDLSKRFGHKVLFENLTYHFPQGERIALCGANGIGKTTLLNIICQEEESDSGRIIMPNDFVLGYLPQEVNPLPKETILEECLAGAAVIARLQEEIDVALENLKHDNSPKSIERYEQAESAFRIRGGYSGEAKAIEILAGLGFDQDSLTMPPTKLSGGWRVRLELAKVFINNPDFLILDEPTNYLDLPSLTWVEGFLRDFRGTLLFVSHDRTLLNKLTTIVLHLHNRTLTGYKGNFDNFLEERAIRQQTENANKLHLQKKIEHLERFVERFRAKATKASQAQSRLKMIAGLKALEDDWDREPDDVAINFTLPPCRQSGKTVLKIDQMAIGYDRALAQNINMELTRGNRIAVIGYNGIGKSTFLKTVYGSVARLTGAIEYGHNVKMAYFAQDQMEEFDGTKSVLATISRISEQASDKEIRNLLASFLFRADDVYKEVKMLSGGEKARLAICGLLVQNANCLLLDEPTNHLDMSSVEVLEAALSEYKGSMIFVSHNRDFINAIATHIFVMLKDGRSMLFEGQLDDYVRSSRLSGFPNVLATDTEIATIRQTSSATDSSSTAKEDHHKRRELLKDLKRNRNRFEKKIAVLEQDLEQGKAACEKIEKDIADCCHTDFTRINELHQNLKRYQDSQSDLEEQLLEAMIELENLDERLKEMVEGG